ncbi:ice-structuring glycoprotein [Drosophila busckii]|uniref:ice-structuring glycoprotein n=1 Tax=Drosophila busckii TaxID=30019 RepID=UPI00083F48D1|nr:ice-structuring glycoprotein [Drosophila busckii]
MERRSSLIMTSPRPSTQPIADSTWIDSTNRPTPPHLRWNLSPKHRSSSSGCLNVSSYSDMQQNNSLHQTSRTSVSKLTRQKLNLSQLDPETFADVHSSGLTSRIVKYQQDQQARANTGGLQRSISFNNVYKPVTQARRTTLAPPLGRKSHLPSIAMTRIAPPERSFYCGNTLPGLLRSNSLVGVEPSNSEQLLRENRPIMHPPPLQHESEPTRSVLEELKEISRKRINSSDMQQPDNKTKKTCNRFADFVDHPGPLPQVHLPIPMNMPPHAQPSFKRNRELSVAVPLGVYHSPLLLPQLQQLFQHPPTHANSVSPQQSPEQQAKRRNCNYSNDIASSLSSSKPHSNKRKLYNMRQKLSQTNISMQSTSAANSSSCSSSSPDTSPSQQAAKIQRKYTTSDYAAEQLSKAQSMPITPLPATPAASVQATLSAPLEQQTAAAAAAAAKPKLILFNAKQRQQAAGTERTLDFDSPDVDAGEYAGIQFVQPKQQNSLSGKNISMERTQKSKLALMLSSLRGEIYQDEPEPEPTATTTTAAAAADQLDASLPPATALPTPIKPMPIAATTTATVTATTAIKPIILSNVNVTPMPAFNLPASTAATSSVAPTTITTSISMPLLSVTSTGATTTTNMDGKATLPGLKLPTATAAPLLTFNTPATTTTAAPVLTFNSPAATTATAIVSPTLATTNVAAAASAPVFAFGNFAAATKSATPPTFGLTAVTANTTTAAAATATTTTTTTASTAATSNTGMFAFGAAQSVATTTASAPMFAFGNATSTAAATITPAAVTTTTASATPAIFSFGSPAATATPTTTAAAATFSINSPAASSNNSMFAFGANNNSNNTASSNSNPGGFASVFKTPAPVGAAAPAATNSAAEANKLFGFGNTTKFTPVTTSAIPSPFATAPKPAATATVAPIFGTAASPMFGTAATTPASTAATNLFSFGGSTEANKSATAAPTTNSGTNLFSFGGAAKDATAASNTNSFGFNAQPAAATAANSNAFGFNAQQTPQFGSSSANNNNTAAAAAKPFAFGATTQQQSAAPAAAANGGFSFSSAAQKSGSTNLFGAPAANPTTGIVKPSFGFGASSTPAAAAAATTAAAPTAAAPTFGGFGAAAPTSSNQNKPFAFGAATNNSTASPIGGNLFASAVSAAQNQAKPASFAFSQAGSNSAATNPNANAPFAFGAAQPQSGGMPKPFAFGAAANSTPAQNLFGSPAAAPAPAASTGAFNFSGMPGTPQQQQQQQQQPQINGGNMFAPPSTPENRPIRRATRRLQK